MRQTEKDQEKLKSGEVHKMEGVGESSEETVSGGVNHSPAQHGPAVPGKHNREATWRLVVGDTGMSADCDCIC